MAVSVLCMLKLGHARSKPNPNLAKSGLARAKTIQENGSVFRYYGADATRNKALSGPIYSGMNERSNRYAINALKERRAEIDGEIEAGRRRLEKLTEAIIHLDASIALLDPTYNPASVRPKRLYRRAKLFGGKKLTGLVLDALRRAERPLSTQEVVAAITTEVTGGWRSAYHEARWHGAGASRTAGRGCQRGRAEDGVLAIGLAFVGTHHRVATY
jgi:hypothetical protein